MITTENKAMIPGITNGRRVIGPCHKTGEQHKNTAHQKAWTEVLFNQTHFL